MKNLLEVKITNNNKKDKKKYHSNNNLELEEADMIMDDD